ncbi:hypothetical protein [Acinetobacter baumannii]|uniref:Uncharacterized protein n=1 Tax=Acinetobacter baumannii TaxID=470 RepID=A0ABD5D8S1_ACIBA|nr:hypothetical protein [Acinetobacter baumannii]EHU2760882.1 hypothetical protein [Acinetobacter baumannii]EKV7389850.1 hypothetical protein [Acinetobacter baumannii]EKW3202904.1 hypothetical protein [Acinetobacter baumannii]EKX0107482.1 hypothetical protein [Acinetobacter baumannii]ELB5354682.1 hypothetical protein [Acinetobacter baumannii]
MQITNAVKLLVELENDPNSLTDIVLKSLLTDDPLKELEPELQTEGHRARILSVIQIIDEIKIESILSPISEELSKVLTSTEILTMTKAKENVEIEMVEARKRIKDLASKIKNIR